MWIMLWNDQKMLSSSLLTFSWLMFVGVSKVQVIVVVDVVNALLL